jgi:hypoxanthine phosphoribosyltransferase
MFAHGESIPAEKMLQDLVTQDLSKTCLEAAAWARSISGYVFTTIGVGWGLWSVYRKFVSAMTPDRKVFTFRELRILCDNKLRIPVQRFDPHVIYCFDAGCAVWAELLLDYLTRRPAIVVGERVKASKSWEVKFPDDLVEGIGEHDRVLILCDYVRTGSALAAAVEYFSTKGIDAACIRTLGLIVADGAKAPDISGHGVEGEIALPYTKKLRRWPWVVYEEPRE